MNHQAAVLAFCPHAAAKFMFGHPILPAHFFRKLTEPPSFTSAAHAREMHENTELSMRSSGGVA